MQCNHLTRVSAGCHESLYLFRYIGDKTLPFLTILYRLHPVPVSCLHMYFWTIVKN
ncbi:hypothetical protein C0J52_01121 [Blattella germanica]|nr:hypothetical protein C0J52_01121 [Blattella germanica]